MKVKVGDKVRVLTGKDRGHEGKVLTTYKKKDRVIVEGVNIVKKHIKPGRTNETGSIQSVEASIHVSNVKVIDATKKETKKVVKKAEVKEVAKKEAKPKATKATEKKAK